MTIRNEILEPVQRVLHWMLRHRDKDGRIICPEHGIEHTGKNAGAIVMACELAPHTDFADELFDVAVQQGRRLVERLEREGESTCFTFRPGRHDPYNCSNNVIDGGACSDALAQLVQTFGDRLDAADREAFGRASVLHAQTYLRYALLDKGVPAQRAWAMTGVAQAWSLAGHEVLQLATTEGVGVLESIQHPDGSYPYHPLEWGAAHPGASDVSAFYQSRVTAFLMFALERLGRTLSDELFAPPILRGLEFLLGLQGPDGIKCGLVEAKPWYWGANHEVASHPFDVYALSAGWRHFGRPRMGDGAARAFEAWAKHIASDGEPQSHLPGAGRRKSYQCPMFWAGHTSWMARSMADLERIFSRPALPPARGEGLELSLQHFPDAGVTRLEDGAVAAWVRGARPGFNIHHGSPHGAGLLRAYSKKRDEELLARCRLAGANEGEWSGKLGGFSLGRGWESGKQALRFSTWLARNHWRGGRAGAALLEPARTLRDGVLAFGSSRIGSAFDCSAESYLLSDGVQLKSALARRDGTPIPGSELERTFRVDGDGLVVEEALVAAGGVRGLDYRVPASASEVLREAGQIHYRLA